MERKTTRSPRWQCHIVVDEFNTVGWLFEGHAESLIIQHCAVRHRTISRVSGSLRWVFGGCVDYIRAEESCECADGAWLDG